jgi:hypothetical protein
MARGLHLRLAARGCLAFPPPACARRFGVLAFIEPPVAFF